MLLNVVFKVEKEFEGIFYEFKIKGRKVFKFIFDLREVSNGIEKKGKKKFVGCLFGLYIRKMI